MTRRKASPQADWNRLRPEAVHAVGELGKLLASETSSQDVLDMYLYTKKILAESIKSLLLSELPEETPEFDELREQLGKRMKAQYGKHVPAKYLSVPYGSKTHRILFTIMFQRMGEPVRADRLRYSTSDSVHTERRIRELRELGIPIDTSEMGGVNVYTLRSLVVDTSLIPNIIKNNLRGKKASKEERSKVLAYLDLDE
ncbi:hypothetical protein [Nocardia brasiliensis]|uniref:hypothetical protein n=1 Tax=Nocardia brasiliensis TaxID=37326 RepID=UPI00245664D9|nr:hypothetical protein [Nocardia brasiliensis]